MDPMKIQTHLRMLNGLNGPGALRLPETPIEPTRPVGPVHESRSFEAVLTEAVGAVDTQMRVADQAAADLAAGRSADLHGTMIAMQKADVQFRTLVEVRNKMLKAYEEVMRMNV